MVTPKEIEAFIEKKIAPHITLKVSVEIAEALVCMMEAQAKHEFDMAGKMIRPENCVQLMNQASLWRAMAEKLKRACTDWHRKNQLGGS